MKKHELEPYYRLLHESPVAAAILDASGLKLDMANEAMLNLWHRPSSILGTALLDFLPELADQAYPKLIQNVIDTGEVHQESGARVILERLGKKESVFMDYSYTPIFSDGHKANAVLVMATDVCEREINRLIINQSDRDLRCIVSSAPVAMCIYRGMDFKLEVANHHMRNIWQGESYSNRNALNHVFYNRVPYTEVIEGVKYCYTPLGDASYNMAGICVVASVV